MAGGDGAVILVVEDERSTRRILSGILSGAGFSCIEAADAETGFDAALRDGASAAVVDLHLPGMSGVELAWRLRQRWPDFPVVAVSGYLHLWEADDLADLGVFKTLRKPFGPNELVRLVREALKHRSDCTGLQEETHA